MNQNNIEDSAGARYQYSKCEGAECQTHGSPYDCSSIMHYTDWAFKIDGVGVGPTMTPKNAETCSLGDYGIRLTDNDVTLLRVIYLCAHDVYTFYLCIFRKCTATRNIRTL